MVMLKLQSQTLLKNQVRCSSSIVSFLMYLAHYSRQFYLTARFNLKLKFKFSSERLRQPSDTVLGRPLTCKFYEKEIKFPCL